MSGAIKVGTLVMVVNTGVRIDGATGQVIEMQAIGFGRCLCGCGKFGIARGIGVRLARPLDGESHFAIPRRNLIPLEPPAGTTDEHQDVGLGVGAAA